MKSIIDQMPNKPSDVPGCDWHAWIKMGNGNYMCLQFGTRGIDQEKANKIIEKIAELDLT